MEEKKLRWVRLDNAAKIYPAARRKGWSNLFRQSVTLTEPVDTQVLQEALDATVGRFPSIAARLRKGVFWYYLHQVKQAPTLSPEYSYPLVYMSQEEMRRCALRVIAYENRIAVEFFHSLTDGTGAMYFLKSLTAEYLERKHGIQIPAEHGVLDRQEQPQEEELEDSFLKYAGRVPASRKDTDAWHLSGQLSGRQDLTCFQLPVEQTLELAHGHGCSVTVFLTAVMMQALDQLQRDKVRNWKKWQRIKVLVPVDLRKLFPSQTLRNFALYIIPEIDPRQGEYTLQEICDLVRHKIGLERTQKHMSGMIATNVGDEQKQLVKLIPLPLKNMVMKAIFDTVGERKSCLSFSNLGQIRLPEAMLPYVERMDFILGTQAAAPYNCGVLSFGNTIYVNFIRNTRLPELERYFYGVLRELGLPVTVQSNQK